MKKLFYLTALTLVFIIGCSKNNDFQFEKDQIEILPDVNLTEIVKNFGSEQATFSSNEEFAAFLQKFEQISEKEQQELISLVNYETLDSILAGAYEGMNDLETKEEFLEYLEQYEDYLELVELINGEEEVQEKEITGHSIYSFLNADKIIKIGNTFRKYFSEICVESEDKNELLKLHSTEVAIQSGLEYFTAYSWGYSVIKENEIDFRSWGEVNKFREWEKQNDEFWCKNKRKVRFKIGIGKQTIDTYITLPDGRLSRVCGVSIYREALVHPYRKGIPCIWYKYKTDITWNNFDTEYDIILNGVNSHINWYGPNWSSNGYGLKRHEKILTVQCNELPLDVDCQWIKIKSDITTTGIGPEWLYVNWHM